MKRTVTESLNEWKSSANRKPLILRGARQVGKTYILKEFGGVAFPRCHYVNFEKDERLGRIFEQDLKPGRILDELQFYLDQPIDCRRDLVIFDEIQRSPKALTSLKYFSEEMPELALCAAGSLLGVALQPDSFPVGKIQFLDMHPLSFDEFLDGAGKERLAELIRKQDLTQPFPETAHEQLWGLWKHYLIVGGLPDVVNHYRERQDNLYEAVQIIRKVQRDLLEAYLADMAKHSGKTNALHIEKLWRNVPAQLARSQNGSAGKFKLREGIPGIRGYERLSAPLDWLEVANLLIRTPIIDAVGVPLSGYVKENRFKLYFFDVGLLGAVSGIAPATFLNYDFGSYQGYVVENFVAQELRAAGDKTLYCWQGRTAEVEFLLEREGEIVPVEVKSGWVTQSKSLKVYTERYRPPRAYILSANNISRRNIVRYLPLYAAGRLNN
ncbi:MAG: AAA family ATPase [Syntrophales bacterium]|nr:AAA family ATPase [Syntrophales bacterium]